ncbi:hypothetical protein NCS52_00863000 [Fusarium sp. LHS14.1]|nr:hypothetical protein NCS52_00863000 [Fusarium sp. LHS14.1]
MGSSMRWLAVAAVAACALFDNSNASDVPPQGPEPTAPARIRALRPFQGLFRREDGTVTETLDITVAPDTLCGFYTPSTTYSFTCSPGTSCMWENNKYNLAFCGIEDFKTACIGQADATDDDKCDDNCRRDPNIQFCTLDSRPFCFTIYMPNGIKKYPCHTAAGFSSMIFPDGAANYATSTMDVTIYEAATTKPSESTNESTAEESKDETESDAETTKPKAAKTVTVGPTASSESESEKDASEDDGNEKSDSSKTNIGAIVGGVVGGIAVIAAVILAIFWIRRRDKNKAQPVQQVQPPPQQQMQYPVMAQQQQMPYQGWQQTPPPQGFQQSPSPQGFHQTPSPQGFQQSPSTQTSVPGAVEAPDSNAVAVFELPDKVEYK